MGLEVAQRYTRVQVGLAVLRTDLEFMRGHSITLIYYRRITASAFDSNPLTPSTKTMSGSSKSKTKSEVKPESELKTSFDPTPIVPTQGGAKSPAEENTAESSEDEELPRLTASIVGQGHVKLQ